MKTTAIEEARKVATGEKPWMNTLALADEKNVVEHDELEATLEKIRSKVQDPNAGLFGPGSVIWRIYREQSLGLAGGCALLLQTAHPFVAHAVQQHSAYQSDPQGRGERTFKALFAWIYGDLDRAFRAARRTWGVHKRITGPIAESVGPYDKNDDYAANEQHALFWVHCTLMETPLRCYEMVFGELSKADHDRFYEETKLFAMLFGIKDDIIPPTFGDFIEFNRKMFESDVLTVDAAGMDVARYVLAAPVPAAVPVVEWYKIITAGLLPPRVRHGYRFRWGRFEERVFDLTFRAARAGVPLVPPMLRQSPLYRAALRRATHTKPGLVEKQVGRAYARMENRLARVMA